MKKLSFGILIGVFFLGILCPSICAAIGELASSQSHDCCSTKNIPLAKPPCCSSHELELSKATSQLPTFLSDIHFVYLHWFFSHHEFFIPATFLRSEIILLTRPPDYLIALNTIRLLC